MIKKVGDRLEARLAEAQSGEDLEEEYRSELVHSGWGGESFVEMEQCNRTKGQCSAGMA